MVILKKMNKNQERKPEEIEKSRQKFISNAEKNKKEKEWVKILLRIRSDFIEHIDESIKDEFCSTRTSWILETIHQRIKREKSNCTNRSYSRE